MTDTEWQQSEFFRTIARRIDDLESHLEERLVSIEATLENIASRLGKRKLDSLYLSHDEASLIIGKTRGGLRGILQRERQKVNGFPIRVIHGGVNRQDFLNFIKHLEEKKPGAGAIVHRALANLRNK